MKPPPYVYPPDPWRLLEKRFFPRFLAQTETIFSTGNGYLGMRGTFEEGTPVSQSGTFINGFHETWPIVYGEEAYGFARTGQTIVNVPDTKIIKLYIDDEPFYLPRAHLFSFERALNMKEGTLDREIVWETPAGKKVSIKSRRLVSFQHRHLAAISYQVTVLNAKAPMVISSEILEVQDSHEDDNDDPRKARRFKDRVLIPKGDSVNDRRIMLTYITKNSRMTLACGIDHTIETECANRYTGKSSE
jgi:alpha,alpha-trehalose phosphorylase